MKRCGRYTDSLDHSFDVTKVALSSSYKEHADTSRGLMEITKWEMRNIRWFESDYIVNATGFAEKITGEQSFSFLIGKQERKNNV